MKMSPQMQKRAKAAFQQGIVDEDNGRYASARLRIDEKVRDFYDAARKQRAEQLRPEREAKEAARQARYKKQDEEANERLIAAIPSIKKELDRHNPLGALRLVLNAQIGI
jgi:hypothetical protein